ncbi:MAG: YihA family ribosome biogenesis GTP-binding protein [Chlorobi bacterium]|nr:YihA family ribosome biogenesis GTP-binding protein [Chlorobiota bacterium]
MKIKSAKFIISNTKPELCPKTDKPEYAFVGRSNVGKSSLINMLTYRNKLAKISVKPGKTRLINHFLINEQWYLVDLPGYGYAKVSKADRKKWELFIRKYIMARKNLVCLFVLIDARHEPQKNDLEFMEWLGINEIPFAIVYTKSDKLSGTKLTKNISHYKNELLKTWEKLPESFITSAPDKTGKEELLNYIDKLNKNY